MLFLLCISFFCSNFAPSNLNLVSMDKRDLSLTQLFNLSFGFFGVQIAYALQSANISRITSSSFIIESVIMYEMNNVYCKSMNLFFEI